MKNKRFPVFYTIYFTLIVLFIVGLFTGLIFLNDYLEAYENTRPWHAMERVMNEYFLTDDKSPLLLKSGYSVPKYSSISDVLAYLGDAIDPDDIAYYKTSSDETKTVYNVVSKDLKIASVELTLGEKGEKEPFAEYELSKLSLTIGGSTGLSVKAPTGYPVFVNGYELTSEYLTGEAEQTESCKHMYGDAQGITYVTYTLEGLFGEPIVTAKTNDRKSAAKVSSDETKVFYTVEPSYSEPDEELSSMILAASEYYAAYMQGDVPFGKVSPYLDRESDLYVNVKTSDTRWVIDHNGYSTENPEISEFYFYSDDVFSCRVKFTHVLHGYGGNTYEENFDETFYFRNVNGSFLIYDSYNH